MGFCDLSAQKAKYANSKKPISSGIFSNATVNPLSKYPFTYILGNVNVPCHANDDELEELFDDFDEEEEESIDDEDEESDCDELESIDEEEEESIDEVDAEKLLLE